MERLNASPSAYFLKWINCSNERLTDGEFTRVNHVLIYCTSRSNQVLGFTFLEPRTLDATVLNRLKSRIGSAVDGERFTILAPRYLESRLNSAVIAEFEGRVQVEFTSFFSILARAGQIRVRSQARVVCVDDSPLLLKLLKKTFDELGGFEVVSQISDSKTAVDRILQLKPDLVTMDIQMPGMTGVEVVKQLAPQSDVPILMISSVTLEDGGFVFDALNSGAFDYIQKPSHDEFDRFRNEVSEKAIAALSPYGRRSKRTVGETVSSRKIEKFNFSNDLIWLIGASTGGTQALTQILTRLPKHIPPVLIVQHIPPVFSKAFADSLNSLCPFTVKEAEDGDVLMESHVYIAPGGTQMALKKRGPQFYVNINDDSPVNRFKPSVDYLLHSAAALGRLNTVAGILTGMGRDGAAGLLELKKCGARTFAQDEKSSAVFGMPRAAIENGAAQAVLSLEKVADFLVRESLIEKQAG